MSFPFKINKSHSFSGLKFREERTLTAKHGQPIALGPSDLPAAKTGALTTRTQDDEGTLTMDAGHGITTGARLDLYWDGGVQRGILVGTVSTNSVPFTGGVGNVLPAQDTEITAMVPVEEELVFAGNDLVALSISSTKEATIVFEDSGGEELHVYLEAGGVYEWHNASGVPNPVAGDAIESVFVSQGDSGGGATVQIGVLHD